MTIVSINPKRYTLPKGHLISLAEECFGKRLDVAGHDEGEAIEFGFDGDAEGAAFEGLTTVQHGRWTARSFELLVNSPTWQRDMESA